MTHAEHFKVGPSPYHDLAGAIIRQALEDAQGHIHYVGYKSIPRIRQEAREWLAGQGISLLSLMVQDDYLLQTYQEVMRQAAAA